MPGTVEGGRKAALTNLSLYGNEFYKKIGRKGGKKAHADGKKTGFALLSPEERRRIGANVGKKSKRSRAMRIEVEFK